MEQVAVPQVREPAPTSREDSLAGVICLVPEDLPPHIAQSLEQHFAITGVSVRVTKGRRSDRRAGDDRRNRGPDTPEKLERRLSAEVEARRFSERRAELEPVDAPILPTAALPYADQLRFVRRRPRHIDDSELSRLRRLTEAWRDRAGAHDKEARGLASSLVGLVEDLRQLRTLTPRWFLAVRRGDQAIAEYRERHTAR
jgi:hypothetical protein